MRLKDILVKVYNYFWGTLIHTTPGRDLVLLSGINIDLVSISLLSNNKDLLVFHDGATTVIIEKGFDVIFNLSFRLCVDILIFEVHARWEAVGKLERERNSIITRHQGRDGEGKAGSAVLENVLSSFSFLVVSFMTSINMSSNTFNPADLLCSFDLNCNISWRARLRNSKIDWTLNQWTRVINWL